MNRLLLRLEGLAVLLLGLVIYRMVGGPWLWLPVLLILPDIGLLGRLANKRVGAVTYNLTHTYCIPRRCSPSHTGSRCPGSCRAW